MIISLDVEQDFDKLQQSFMIKVVEIRDTRDIPKHKKGNLQQANTSQHQTK